MSWVSKVISPPHVFLSCPFIEQPILFLLGPLKKIKAVIKPRESIQLLNLEAAMGNDLPRNLAELFVTNCYLSELVYVGSMDRIESEVERRYLMDFAKNFFQELVAFFKQTKKTKKRNKKKKKRTLTDLGSSGLETSPTAS